MRRASRCPPTPLGPLTLAVAALGLGCTATVTEPTWDGDGAAAGGAGSSIGSGGTVGTGGTVGAGGTTGTGGSAAASPAGSGGTNGTGAGPGDASGGAGAKPTLAQVADQYFPNQAASAAKRVFRLTRGQLDITTKTLLPGTMVEANLPRDPLQTNYEYADNLGFNAANFTPFVDWVAAVAAAVKADPTSVIDCGSSDPSTACLTDQAKAFVSRAFRGTASDAQLARYADFFLADVASLGLPVAVSTLVELVLTSPSYVLRDEVLTDAADTLLPAQRLQNITYTLADTPPEAVGLSSATPDAYLKTPELAQQTIDQVLASNEARDKLTRFFLAWLEVKEPDAFTIATSAFPQDAGQVYESLMQRVNLLCAQDSNQASTDTSLLRAQLERKQSLIDFRLADIDDAKRALGMDSVHAQKLDGLVDGWREVEKATTAELAGLDGGTTGGAAACPALAKPTGNAENKNNCDQLSPVADQMIDLVRLAFEWDLTRVVSMTMSGASSGHRWPSQGVDKAHHTLEHSNDVAGQNVMGGYFAEKFARLLAALKTVDDGDGKTALFNSSVLLGMECWSDSSSGHYLKNIPFIFAGQGAGAFQTGRVVNAAGRNNNDLLISIQNASGIASSTFGLASLCQGAII